MAPRKPAALISRDETKAARQARVSGELLVQPLTELSKKPPARLAGHRIAQTEWKRLIGLYQEIEGTVATAFDQNLLVEYCLVIEELTIDLPQLHKMLMATYKRLDKKITTVQDNDELFKITRELANMAARIQAIDARRDRKRKLVQDFSQAFYLTPRSRAGVAPPTKEPDEPQDEMSKLLDGTKSS